MVDVGQNFTTLAIFVLRVELFKEDKMKMFEEKLLTRYKYLVPI